MHSPPPENGNDASAMEESGCEQAPHVRPQPPCLRLTQGGQRAVPHVPSPESPPGVCLPKTEGHSLSSRSETPPKVGYAIRHPLSDDAQGGLCIAQEHLPAVSLPCPCCPKAPPNRRPEGKEDPSVGVGSSATRSHARWLSTLLDQPLPGPPAMPPSPSEP